MTTTRICFVGDSYVNGTGDPEGLGWAGRVCAEACRRGHDVTRYDLGVRRDTSADILARWETEARRRLPEGVDGRLVFSFGVNDTTLEHGAPRIAPPVSEANAREILGAAQRWTPPVPILMVGPPPTADPEQNLRTADLSQVLVQACADLGVPYLEVFPLLDVSDVWMIEVAAGDGAHPGAAGYLELAKLVEAWPPWAAWFEA
jgi:lysophospholipase L1-like esterase